MVLDNAGWNLAGRIYRKTISEGFLLGEGYLSLGDFLLPALQLMKVHPEHPLEVIYNGSVLIRPEGDKRIIGEIQRDLNRALIYDGVSLFLCPPEYHLPERNKIHEQPNGFEYPVNGIGNLKVGHAESTEVIIGSGDITSIVEVAPPFIPRVILQWLLSEPKVKKLQGWEFETFGRTKLDASAAYDISKRLEERFETQMFPK